MYFSAVERGKSFVHTETLIFQYGVLIFSRLQSLRKDHGGGAFARRNQFACPEERTVLQFQGHFDPAEVLRRIGESLLLLQRSGFYGYPVVAGQIYGVRQLFHRLRRFHRWGGSGCRSIPCADCPYCHGEGRHGADGENHKPNVLSSLFL